VAGQFGYTTVARGGAGATVAELIGGGRQTAAVRGGAGATEAEQIVGGRHTTVARGGAGDLMVERLQSGLKHTNPVRRDTTGRHRNGRS